MEVIQRAVMETTRTGRFANCRNPDCWCRLAQYAGSPPTLILHADLVEKAPGRYRKPNRPPRRSRDDNQSVSVTLLADGTGRVKSHVMYRGDAPSVQVICPDCDTPNEVWIRRT